MRHYVPLQTATGWGVCYQNHRGEFIALMECPTLESAYRECVAMTDQARAEAARILNQQPAAASVATGGNRYLRRYA